MSGEFCQVEDGPLLLTSVLSPEKSWLLSESLGLSHELNVMKLYVARVREKERLKIWDEGPHTLLQVQKQPDVSLSTRHPL